MHIRFALLKKKREWLAERWIKVPGCPRKGDCHTSHSTLKRGKEDREFSFRSPERGVIHETRGYGRRQRT